MRHLLVTTRLTPSHYFFLLTTKFVERLLLKVAVSNFKRSILKKHIEMRGINLKLTDHVLVEDVKEANRLIIWGSYCVAQMDYCVNNFNLEGSRYWNLEYQRSINDLKALQFKKINTERVGIDVKV